MIDSEIQQLIDSINYPVTLRVTSGNMSNKAYTGWMLFEMLTGASKASTIDLLGELFYERITNNENPADILEHLITLTDIRELDHKKRTRKGTK